MMLIPEQTKTSENKNFACKLSFKIGMEKKKHHFRKSKYRLDSGRTGKHLMG